MSTSLQSEDYEKLYEDGLWRLQQALASSQEVHDSSDGDYAKTRQARIIMARSNLDGILQQQSKIGNRRDREAAQVHRLTWRLSTSRSAQGESSLFTPTTPASRPLPEKCLARHFNASVHEFFDMYPETMRQEKGMSDESSSSSDDEELLPPKKTTKKGLDQQQKQQQIINIDDDDDSPMYPPSQQAVVQVHPASPSEPPLPHSSRQRKPQTINPYAKPTSASRPPTQQVLPTASQQQQLLDNHSSSSISQQQTSVFSYTPVEMSHDENRRPPSRSYYSNNPPPPAADHSLAWEDHQRQNPFQTAREFSVAEEKSKAHSRRLDSNHNPYHQQQQKQYEPPPQEEDEVVPVAPVIPESLRRKFQPPMRTTHSKTKSTTGAASTSNKQKQQQQQQQQKKTGPDNQPNQNNDDDDDLPEELKRFGKDLVEKIENEIMDGGDPITFDDIAGLQDAKQTIQEVICWPMKRPDLFTGLRKAPNGLLLYGPPGTGKTLIGKAIAHESGATFFSISSSSLTSKWIGESEKLVRTMFAVAAYREPSVVFIDEIDSLLTQRKADENEASRRIKTEFLVQLDGTGTTAQGRVLTIGATNRPQELDEAARRRFTKRLYIPLPVEVDRATLLHVLLAKNNHRLTPAEVNKLARETDGYSGADLKTLCTDAAMGPIRQLGAKALQVEATDVPPISYKHFRQSLRSMKPSVAPDDLVQYVEWDKVYGSKRAEEEMDEDSSCCDDGDE